MKTYIFSLLIFTISLTSFIYAPANFQNENNQSIKTTKVFINSQNEGLVEELEKSFPKTLLSTFDNDVEIAFANWKMLINDINAFANYNNTSLSGIKIWLKVFYSKDGQIEYLAYDLKGTSKKVNTRELTHLLNKFILLNKRKFNQSETNFSHFSSISF